MKKLEQFIYSIDIHDRIEMKVFFTPERYYRDRQKFKRDIKEFEREERKGKQLEINL